MLTIVCVGSDIVNISQSRGRFSRYRHLLAKALYGAVTSSKYHITIVCVLCVDEFMIGCVALATTEQWTPHGNFKGTIPPPPTREFFRKGTIEWTMRCPTITLCEDLGMCVCVFM